MGWVWDNFMGHLSRDQSHQRLGNFMGHPITRLVTPEIDRMTLAAPLLYAVVRLPSNHCLPSFSFAGKAPPLAPLATCTATPPPPTSRTTASPLSMAGDSQPPNSPQTLTQPSTATVR
jgi:hypothetical protein